MSIPPHRRWYVLAASGGVVLLLAIPLVLWLFGWQRDDSSPTFTGRSDELRQTVIVPTLDTRIPEGKSAIWCSTFQIAWNRLKDDVIKEPIRLDGAQEVADRLNRAEQSEADIPAENYYAAAGLVGDGILETIRSEMGERFPGVAVPEHVGPFDVAITYAYLNAEVQYEHVYANNRRKLTFKDSTGKETAVRSFGIPREMVGYESKPRDQVQVLFSTFQPESDQLDEFAADLCRSSTPNQVIVACIRPRGTLQEMLSDLEENTRKHGGDRFLDRWLTSSETLLVPNMNWSVDHLFNELHEKWFLNQGHRDCFLGKPCQLIRFRLDRTGAAVESSATATVVRSLPRDLHFNRPFLIVMKKRDAKQPFFVMWVDNAELLSKW